MTDREEHRDKSGRFAPGNKFGAENHFKPGNPGRPKGTITSRLAELLESELPGQDGKTLADAVARVVVQEAVKGNAKFVQMLMDRVEGKVPDRIAGPKGEPIAGVGVLEHLTPDEAAQLRGLGRKLMDSGSDTAAQ